MILALVVLPSVGDGLPLFSHTRYLFSPFKATQLAEAFRILMRTTGKGANPHKGTTILLRHYLTSYVLVNELYILTIQPPNGNPFADQSLLKRTKSYLISFCKGDVTSTRLMKSYSEVFIALDKLLFEQLHLIESNKIQNTENDWLWRRQEFTLEGRRYEEILKPNQNHISERHLSLRAPLLDNYYGDHKETEKSSESNFDPFKVDALPDSAEITEGYYHPPSPRINFIGGVSASASSPDIYSIALEQPPTSNRDKEQSEQPAIMMSSSTTIASSAPNFGLKNKRDKRKSILGSKSASTHSVTDEDPIQPQQPQQPVTPGRNLFNNLGRRSTTGLGRIARDHTSR